MNRRSTRLLQLLFTPLFKLTGLVIATLERHVGRKVMRSLPESPAVMGIPLVVMRGDPSLAASWVEEILRYIARSPRHFEQLRRTLTCLGVGGPAVKHGTYIFAIHGCNLGVSELQADSIPALAATVVFVSTQARLQRVGFDTRRGPREMRRRALRLCARSSREFLDYVQHGGRAA